MLRRRYAAPPVIDRTNWATCRRANSLFLTFFSAAIANIYVRELKQESDLYAVYRTRLRRGPPTQSNLSVDLVYLAAESRLLDRFLEPSVCIHRR